MFTPENADIPWCSVFLLSKLIELESNRNTVRIYKLRVFFRAQKQSVGKSFSIPASEYFFIKLPQSDG